MVPIEDIIYLENGTKCYRVSALLETVIDFDYIQNVIPSGNPTYDIPLSSVMLNGVKTKHGRKVGPIEGVIVVDDAVGDDLNHCQCCYSASACGAPGHAGLLTDSIPASHGAASSARTDAEMAQNMSRMVSLRETIAIYDEELNFLRRLKEMKER